MDASFLDQIDWQRPWLSPLRPIAAEILHAPSWQSALNAAATQNELRNHRGLRIRFVPQAELPSGTAYEAFISATGGVPMRDNLHDFFNGLIWLSFPKIKAQLNALQAAEIAKAVNPPPTSGLNGANRGKLRDAATIFDENAALLVVRNMALMDALRAHQWRHVFVTERAAFMRDCDVRLFGHALIEKLVSPYKAITAHAWVIAADDAFFEMPEQERRSWIDLQVSRQLACGLASSGFTPLPILAVPGWWPKQDDGFYDDASVFRPKRGMRL